MVNTFRHRLCHWCAVIAFLSACSIQPATTHKGMIYLCGGNPVLQSSKGSIQALPVAYLYTGVTDVDGLVSEVSGQLGPDFIVKVYESKEGSSEVVLTFVSTKLDGVNPAITKD